MGEELDHLISSHTQSLILGTNFLHYIHVQAHLFSLSLSLSKFSHTPLSLTQSQTFNSILYALVLYIYYFSFWETSTIFFLKAHPLREATLRVWDPSEKAWLQLQLRKWFLGFVFQPRSLISFYLHLFYFSLNYMIMMINLLLLLSVCGMS